MIDCENEVFTRIATELRTEFPGINLTSEYVNAPSKFPHVSVVMSDNTLMQKAVDSGNHEVAVAMFEINIYSNKTSGRKAECRDIAKKIDEILMHMNFSRLSMIPVPNLEDASIYRIVARYSVATDGNFFYRK